jgi:hypothetical protein
MDAGAVATITLASLRLAALGMLGPVFAGAAMAMSAAIGHELAQWRLWQWQLSGHTE